MADPSVTFIGTAVVLREEGYNRTVSVDRLHRPGNVCRNGSRPEGHGRFLIDILRSRNIEGVIASPSTSPQYLLKFDFSSYSSATFGYGLTKPNLLALDPFPSIQSLR